MAKSSLSRMNLPMHLYLFVYDLCFILFLNLSRTSHCLLKMRFFLLFCILSTVHRLVSCWYLFKFSLCIESTVLL